MTGTSSPLFAELHRQYLLVPHHAKDHTSEVVGGIAQEQSCATPLSCPSTGFGRVLGESHDVGRMGQVLPLVISKSVLPAVNNACARFHQLCYLVPERRAVPLVPPAGEGLISGTAE